MVEIKRDTKETQIKCSLTLDGCGKFSINTGVGFFDHMLEALSKHSGIDINLECKGDLHIDSHHTVEDCGIVLGQALKKAIFPIQAVERYFTHYISTCCTPILPKESGRGYVNSRKHVSS